MLKSWLDDNLREQYDLVKILRANKNSEICLLRHKTLQKNMIKRTVYTSNLAAYKTLLTISHINIPLIFDVIDFGEYFIVLEEYIEGQTLASVLENGIFSESGVKSIVLQLCNALSAVHQRGIIHRDIKPENIMISSDGYVKLIDFNIARLIKPYVPQDTVIMGTTGYAAPEQFGMTQSDERTDIFAVGVLINVLLTGMHPTQGMCGGKFRKIVEKSIHINPDKRYRNILELQRDIR